MRGGPIGSGWKRGAARVPGTQQVITEIAKSFLEPIGSLYRLRTSSRDRLRSITGVRSWPFSQSFPTGAVPLRLSHEGYLPST
ncbi:hypothetical protein NOVOSPHI9U_290049 [Novosphingobium sp. 9U]|nr:hypothetical protein NOVOSPHI9U_290049 [Novosphingobium sp. 9U]